VIREIRFKPAPSTLATSGLLGWVSFIIGGIKISGVGVRRTLQGRRALAWPVRDSGWGQRSYYVRPIDDATRERIEQQVLEHLEVRGGCR